MHASLRSEISCQADITEAASLRPLAMRIFRSLPFALLTCMFWPMLLFHPCRRPLDRLGRDIVAVRDLITARMAQRSRTILRSIACATPLAASLFAGQGWEALAGITCHVGLLTVYTVLLLCRPGRREQLLLMLLIGYWSILLVVSVLVRD